MPQTVVAHETRGPLDSPQLRNKDSPMVKAIDIVVNLWTTEVTANYPPHLDEFWDLIASSRGLAKSPGNDTTQKRHPGRRRDCGDGSGRGGKGAIARDYRW